MKSFTIYEEYYQLITLLDEIEQQQLILAICKYMFEDIEPKLNKNQLKIFNNLKRPLDKSKNNSQRSIGFGAPKGNNNAQKNKPKTNQKQTKNKPNEFEKTNTSNDVNVNVSNYDNNYVVNVDVNVNKYYEDIELNNLFIEFLQLRKKLKAVNSDRAINLLLNQLSKYDDETKKEMINQSILHSWKSVYEVKKAKETLSEKLQREIKEAEEEEKRLNDKNRGVEIFK